MKTIELSTELWFVEYLLNSIWQLPLIFAAAWVAARLARTIGSRAEHRIWVGALLIETILPACSGSLWNLPRQAWSLVALLAGTSNAEGFVHVVVGPGSASPTGLLRLTSPLLTAIVLVYACALFYCASRLAWGLWKTTQMLREAQPLPSAVFPPPNPSTSRPARFAISHTISGPVTIGIRQNVLLLPPNFLERISEADLDALLAHEFAHIERRDFSKNLLYGFLSLPIAYHPIQWLTFSRLAGTREMICDETAASAVSGPDNYARSLLRLASILTSPMPARTLHAIGIFDANIFERRIMSLARKRIEITASRRLATAAVCAVLALAACASALALRMDVVSPVMQKENVKTIHVKSDSLKLITRVNPVYPPKAKQAGIEGSVVLDAVISKEGVPEHLSVQSGPRDLQPSALDAVRQWRWEPFLLNGDPIEVETTITVVYELEK